MHNWAYEQIFRIIKEAKGYSLEDLPRSLNDIIRAFDTTRYQRENGVLIIQKLLRDTKLWLVIIESNFGRGSPKYIVAYNSLSHHCLKIMDGVIDRLINLALLNDFKLIRGPDIQNQVSEVEMTLKRIGELYMVPENRNVLDSLVQKFQFLQELTPSD